MTIILSGRRNGSTHREVALLASLPGELRLIGGLAVMVRVGSPHRATVDIDVVARGLNDLHDSIASLALTATGGGQYTFAGELDLDVIDVADMRAAALIDQLTDGDPARVHEITDLEMNVVAHTWAHDTATAVDIEAADDETGEILCRAAGRLVASAPGLIAMKATTVGLRASSKPEKRASDLYDIGRLLVHGGISQGELQAMPDALAAAVERNLTGWFVDEGGRDRTFRDVRRFDEPRLDLDGVAYAVSDAFA